MDYFLRHIHGFSQVKQRIHGTINKHSTVLHSNAINCVSQQLLLRLKYHEGNENRQTEKKGKK